MSEILNIATTAITQHLCKKAGFKMSQAKSGAVTLIQRFGGSINLNPHLHSLFLDGVYELDEEGRPDRFHITKAPTHAELSQVLGVIIARTTKYLERRGIITKDEDSLQIDLSDDDALTRLQAGAATYRFALGPNKGKKALTLKTLPDADHASFLGLVAKNSGFSLHAGVAMNGSERDKIEKLCRYIARPAVSLDRLRLNERGQVVYTLKRPYDDGTTHIVMSQLELMERLASIVPRPRVHLTRFSGVFAPHYKYRTMVVLNPKSASSAKDSTKPKTPSRIPWAKLLRRVFDIDLETCHRCGSELRVIASIEDPVIIKHILSRLGLPTKPPQPWPARGPPPLDDLNQHFQFH
jgi:hypothetical protein